MKTVLFVPGFQEDISSRDYASTIKAIESCGYTVKFVLIAWKYTTITKWVQELEEVYSGFDPKETILAGFSYGAMTAFVASNKRTPAELWLFSLSPYFAEDLKSKNMKPAWLKYIGKRRVESFSGLNFTVLSKSIDCKTLLFAGQLEIDKWPIIGNRCSEASKLLKNSKLIIVPQAEHDVAHSKYIDAITDNI